jgi:hypothetical protein
MQNISPDIETKFMAEVRKHGGGMYHDYSNPLHYEYALSRLGGKAFLEKNHPGFFKMMERTKSGHLKNRKLGAAPANTDKDGFADSMKVRAICFDKESLISDVSSNHKETRPSMAIIAKMVDQKSEQIVATSQTYGDEIFSLFAEMKKKTSELVQSDDRVFRTTADFYWLQGNNDMASPGYTVDYQDFKIAGRNSIVDSFVVNDPRAIKTPTRDHVVVVYNRAAVVGEDYDYSYDNSPHDNKVDIYLPASATVTLNPDWTVLGLNRDMGYKLEIEDINKGVVKYYGNGGFDSIQTQISKNIITFTFQDTRYPPDAKYKEYWANALNISNFSAKTTVNIYCQVELNIKNKAGLELHIPVVFQSKNPPSDDKSIATSKPIMIQWGCVGKDTKITMEDGSAVEISRLKVGDIVQDEAGELLSIVDIYSGNEKLITLLETAGGKKVLLTGGHPVATARGVIPASILTAGDMVKTVDGYEAIRDLRILDYNDKAYGLKFADPHMIPCNGIILGDVGTQQSLIVPPSNQRETVYRSRECREAKADFRQLFQQLSQKS